MGTAKYRQGATLYRWISAKHRSKRLDTGQNRPLITPGWTCRTPRRMTRLFEKSFCDKHGVRCMSQRPNKPLSSEGTDKTALDVWSKAALLQQKHRPNIGQTSPDNASFMTSSPESKPQTGAWPRPSRSRVGQCSKMRPLGGHRASKIEVVALDRRQNRQEQRLPSA